MTRTAIQIDNTTGDLMIESGALAIGNTNEQNAHLILTAEKGEFKEYPQLGVGAIKYIRTVGTEKMLMREVAVQLALDGYINPIVAFNNGKLNIEV